MSLSARLSRLENGLNCKDLIVFSVRRGGDPEVILDDPAVQKQKAVAEFVEKNGRQPNKNTTYVQINKIINIGND